LTFIKKRGLQNESFDADTVPSLSALFGGTDSFL
jgi:hypothetical protein